MGNTNICEQFVSFDTAKILKDAGFDVPCNSYYELEGGEVVRKDSIGSSDYNAYEDTVCSRPTQALAARWLREVHHYAICVWFSKDHEKWFYAHGDMDNMAFDTDYNISEFIFDSYEEALEVGIVQVLERIIEETKE